MQTITCDGNAAVARIAYAFSEVAAIYPITPSTPMAELCDAWSAQGKKNLFGQTVRVAEMQSESGVAGAVHGSLSAGALTTTFTASQGLLLMLPGMCKISGELLPTVFHVSARSLAYHALSIFGDHGDVMAARFTGFMLLCSDSVEMASDMAAVAHMATLESCVPAVHFFDGFRTSHEIQKITAMDDDELRTLLPTTAIEHFRKRAMDPVHPHQQGTAQNPDLYFQGREASNRYYDAAADIVQDCMDRVAAITGRPLHLFDYEGAKDAERVIVVMGSAGETCAVTSRFLNGQGEKTGVVHVHLYRPFNARALADALPRTVRRIAVLDRVKEPGAQGEPLFLDVASALKQVGMGNVTVVGGRYGLGSKEFAPRHAKAVFDFLADCPRHNFTVGIDDDVTGLSLPVDASFTLKSARSCLFYGLGSDGTVGANKMAVRILADNTDQHAQAYFAYDSKKSGGLTVSHLRFGKEAIRAPYLVHSADFIGCHNPSFVHTVACARNLAEGGTFLLNWPGDAESLPDGLKRTLARKRAKLHLIDASAIAHRAGLGRRINTIMLAAFFHLSGVMEWRDARPLIESEIRKTYGRKGDDVVSMNLSVLDLPESVLIPVPFPASWANLPEPDAPQSDDNSYFDQFIAPVLRQDGDALPVSRVNPRGIVPTGTSKYEKRGVATHVPRWILEKCIQCGRCSLACPHQCLRSFYPAQGVDLPVGFQVKKATGNAFAGHDFRIQVSPLDCTGCGNCVDICPAPGKALELIPMEDMRGQQRLWDFAMSLTPVETDASTIKTLQAKTPLFEFSGACAGCGETPYIGMLTRLFGERMLIANATGCSSIYGGSAPTCPYTVNADGRGPAWGNSLFEDNAEFALGMRLALNHRDPEGDTTVWAIGGDGWAYDIGFGGLDHVLHSGENVNLLVLDTQVYSNTGGQMSKATPPGATAWFAMQGKSGAKKDLGRIAMTCPDVYVAQVCMGADPQHLLTSLREAEAHDGPSIVIAYAPCIAHGIDMSRTQAVMKHAVDCGFWPLYRRKPGEGLLLDKVNEPEEEAFRAFLMNEGRFSAMTREDGARGEALLRRCLMDARRRVSILKRLHI